VSKTGLNASIKIGNHLLLAGKIRLAGKMETTLFKKTQRHKEMFSLLRFLCVPTLFWILLAIVAHRQFPGEPYFD